MTLAGPIRMLRLECAFRAAGKTLTGDGLTGLWQAVDAVKAEEERPIRLAMLRLFEEQRREVLRRLPRLLSSLIKQDLDGAVLAVLLDVGEWDAVVRSTLTPLVEAAARAGLRTGALRTGLDLTGADLSPGAREVITRVLEKSKTINRTTLADIGRAIERGLERGASAAEIERDVAAYFGEAVRSRARTIAQTTATPAFEVSQQEAFREAGVEANRWLTQRDGVVRPAHDALDGEEVPLGGVFSNGLAYPGDPSGPPAEVIGCRCTLLPILSEKAARRRPHIERRRRDVRYAYPGLRDEHGQLGALEILAEHHSVSVHTIKKDLWG